MYFYVYRVFAYFEIHLFFRSGTHLTWLSLGIDCQQLVSDGTHALRSRAMVVGVDRDLLWKERCCVSPALIV